MPNRVSLRSVARSTAIALVVGCGGASTEPRVVVPIGPATTTAPSNLLRFRSVELGRTVVGADPLTEKAAAGTWHVEVYLENDRAVRFDRVGPTGIRFESTNIAYAADSAQTRVRSNEYGVEVYTDRLAPDGGRSRKYRSGASNEDGCARVHESYDARGLVTSATCVDLEGRVVTDANGCPVRRFAYDDHARLHESRCTSVDGAAATFGGGGSAFVVEYDARGFRRRIARTSASGLPASDDDGCAALSFERDDGGNVATTRCMDAVDTPKGMGGTKAVETRMTYDATGCELEESTVDASGALVAVVGVAKRVHARDAVCGELSLVQLDEHGAHANLPMKVSSYEYVRNTEGLVVEQRCHDANGAPTSCRDASSLDGALVREAYDDHGRNVLRRGFFENGSPSRMSRTYPHEWRYSYAPDGISSVVSYFDEQGVPALANDNVAKHAFVFDRLGSLVSAKSYDALGNAARPSTGCSDIRRTYDASHRLATIECLGPDDTLTPATLILNAILWPPKSARVVVERADDTVVANAYYGPQGDLTKRVPCGPSPCYR